MVEFTYCVLRYIHDRSANESVNVGVLVHSEKELFAELKVEPKSSALSCLFGGFNVENFKNTLNELRRATDDLASGAQRAADSLFPDETWPQDAQELGHRLIPDQGMSFSFGHLRCGFAEDVAAETERLFKRLVVEQRPLDERTDRVNDNKVWARFVGLLKDPQLRAAFRPAEVMGDVTSVNFDHTFNNGRLHAVEPLSFDYLDKSEYKQRAFAWRGRGEVLRETDLKLYFLVGDPVRTSRGRELDEAIALLSALPIETEIVREGQTPEFARRLEAFMKEHNVHPAPEG